MRSTGGARPRPGTLNLMFYTAVEKFNRPNALMVKVAGSYQSISHKVVLQRVRRISLSLADAGFQPGDRIAILATNSPEWAIADYATLTGGFVTVPVYPTLPPEQIRHILADSGAVAIFVQNDEDAARVASIRGELPNLRTVMNFAAESGPEADTTIAALESRGAELENETTIAAHRRAALATDPDDLASIVYTSGTTGLPKGVMLSHDNLYSNVAAAASILPFSRDTSLSILPLSHVFERMAGHFLMFAVGATIAYAESIDTVAANMVEVSPTFVISVPRLYEKLFARVLETARSGGRLRFAIFNWATAVASRWADVKLGGKTPAGLLALQYRIADRLVLSRLRERTGGKLRFFVSGGAPLAPEINKFFYAAGMIILEGYGLTETSPVLAVNTPSNFRIGTVGKPVAGVELKIADDGEILARGPNVMRGYYNNETATREAIDAEGWFHTGDIGELNDGFLSITDRKKDIIVTAGGKNVAPQGVENRIKLNRYVAEAVLIGDRRKFIVVLVVPDFVQLGNWARTQGISWQNNAELIAEQAVKEMMQHAVLDSLSGLASFETPKKVALLAEDFSIDKGEITPSLKVKRNVIDKHYKQLIDSLYEE